MTQRIALVTGAAKGIGLATSQKLIAAGCKVVMVDRLPLDLGKLGISSANALAFSGDVSDTAFLSRLKEQIEARLGTVSILVNNAGISPKRSDGRSSGILEVTLDEWSKVLLINLTTVMQLSQLFLPGMQAQKFGRIVSLSSLAGRSKSIVAGPSYMASKAGVLGLMRAIASEMGPHGITANCVAPGRILTDMAMQAGEEVNRRYAEQIPVRRLGTAEEVADAITFLCAESSGFINGATIDINGGFFMS
ncbi:3-oxoacyl-ACP reductase [Alcaligenaceae bacterium LF4-65]|uniref:3-oxoacyl-ACP reductase n=1 Tax=Zwartia hollandica TaxID=324606 RepID=A0A953T2V4_9BURK|nr:3-oxoacyl-ACP reductase [Zwartia hollandica]MBZ1351888.1 3-oxoacyl-ACP reductase [Zwartia hollandica]